MKIQDNIEEYQNMPELLQATCFQVKSSEDNEATRPNSILSETLLQNNDVKIVRFSFAKGQELSEHTASVAAMICQISGHARWGLGEETKEVEAGEWAYMPANLKHSIHALEDSQLLLVMIKKSGV